MDAPTAPCTHFSSGDDSDLQAGNARSHEPNNVAPHASPDRSTCRRRTIRDMESTLIRLQLLQRDCSWLRHRHLAMADMLVLENRMTYSYAGFELSELVSRRRPTIDPDISIKQQREISAANPSQSALCSTRITVAKVLICTVLRPAPGSDERNISKSSVAPTGGHVFVKMKAPATLISRVTPFPDNLFRC